MTPRQRAEQLEREGKCILCGTLAKSLVRGLCRMHHGRFKASMNRVQPEQRHDFEAMLIENGQLLPNRQGRRIVDGEDEFAKALAEFESQQARAAHPIDPVEARSPHTSRASPRPAGAGPGRRPS